MKDKINKLVFEKKIIRYGDSFAITIPPEVIKYLEAETGSKIIVMPDFGKHGKFVSFWKK